MISLHGLGYYVVWLDQGNVKGGLSWNASNTNLLAGTLSWLCGCALWASSVAWVRRNFYEVPPEGPTGSPLALIKERWACHSVESAHCWV